MPHPANASSTCRGNRALKTLLISVTAISTLGIGLWAWIQTNRSFLPSPDTKLGKELLRNYQELTHNIWLTLLTIAAVYLITHIYRSRKTEELDSSHPQMRWIESCLRFIRNNPITTLLFIAYTVAMIAGTTYLYRDMLGWYPELIKDHFVDNFSTRESFIDETMRRVDYRFFPLAHQDIHILSWFTIHIKTWMLFSAAELIGIVLLSAKFLNDLLKDASRKPSTLLLISALLLIHPSTGTAFFHVIFCERLLCLVFALYITSYLRYRESQQQSDFYLTLLWALLGIYIKDIAILLFIIPAMTLWIWDSMSAEQSRPHDLEQWLCSLTLVFISSYILLALIPSSFAAEDAYNSNAKHLFIPDLRFYLFAAIAAIRAIAIWKQRVKLNMLDAINVAGFAYTLALVATFQFDASSYLSLPIQLIATINIGWAWIHIIETNQHNKTGQNKKIISAILAACLVIGIDHATAKNTFTNTTYKMKLEQSSIQTTYEKLFNASRKIRNSGDDVNIIINAKSRFAANRHLNRIAYRSLVEYDPKNEAFIVKDGANKRSIYTPQVGDLIANLDKDIELINPILDKVETEVIYRHQPSESSGVILRITAIKS